MNVPHCIRNINCNRAMGIWRPTINAKLACNIHRPARPNRSCLIGAKLLGLCGRAIETAHSPADILTIRQSIPAFHIFAPVLEPQCISARFGDWEFVP